MNPARRIVAILATALLLTSMIQFAHADSGDNLSLPVDSDGVVSPAGDGSVYESAWMVDGSRQSFSRSDGGSVDPEPTAASHIYFLVNDRGMVADQGVAYTNSGLRDKASGQTPMQWTVTTNEVALAWWVPEGAQIDRSVSIDGHDLAVTREATFQHSGVDTSSPHTYTIQANDPEHGLFLYQVTTVPMVKSAVGLKLDDVTVEDSAIMADMATEINFGSFRHDAFIADQYVSAPLMCSALGNSDVEYFGGDNRGFSTTMTGSQNSGYRLRNEVIKNMGITGPGGGTFKYGYVGESTGYDEDKNLVETDSAPASSVSQSVVLEGNFTASGSMNMKGPNPLCPGSPNLDAEISWSVKSSGSLSVAGKHDLAPNHEILYSTIDSTGHIYEGCAYRRELVSFGHLTGLPVRATLDVTFNPVTGSTPNCNL